MSQHVHFISDLHLTQQRPQTTQTFVSYLKSLEVNVSDLYILGDLFDSWVGDDDPTPPNQLIKVNLKALTDRGVHVHFLAGNRDFLVGKQFFSDTQVNCLDDEHIIDLFGVKTLLMHGDLLCTDDTEYQQFRQLTHNPAWQQAALAKPLEERLALAQHYRQQSQLNKQEKSNEIMDVNEVAVLSTLKKHHSLRLIHGHTHRPNLHHMTVDDANAERFVLAEWDEHGSVLDFCAEGYRTIELT